MATLGRQIFPDVGFEERRWPRGSGSVDAWFISEEMVLGRVQVGLRINSKVATWPENGGSSLGTENSSTHETNSVRSLGTRLEAVAIDGFVGKY